MDIEKEREAFEKSNNVHPDWSFKFDHDLEQYIAVDHEMQLQVDEFNEYWDTFRAGWLEAKKQAVPNGFVVVPIEPTKEMYLAGTHELTQIDFRDLHDNDSVAVYKAMIQEAQK